MVAPQPRVLIVDDQPENIDILNHILKPFYARNISFCGERALVIANSAYPPDLILLDINMPGMDGYEVCRRLKSQQPTRDIPVIFITALDEEQEEALGFEVGAVDYITKPVSPPVVLARVRTHLELKRARDALQRQNDILEERVRERTKEVELTREVTILSLASLAETRDNETGGHIRRTQNYVSTLARRLQAHPHYGPLLNDATVELLHKSAPLHDIGKVGVSDAILLKPGRLTPDEFEQMKLHTIYGKESIERAEVLLEADGSNSFLRLAREIAYNHHEKWDGSGYPQGIQANDIPLSARLMALADVYDALISRRIYKPPFPHSQAVEIINQGRAAHFDPVVVDAFNDLQENFRDIALRFADYDEERRLLCQ